MADRLTQLQDAVDEFANQMVACVYYNYKHHDLQPVNATDKVRDMHNEADRVEPHPPEQFKAGQRELAQDLITREQQIEMLISILPGLGSSEKYQQERIRALEKEIQDAEKERQEAVKEKEAVLQRLDEVIRSIRRP